MKSTCERVREALWPLDRPRAYVPEEDTAREHLVVCVDCRAFFLRDAELTAALHRMGRGLEAPAPEGLRGAVARALADFDALQAGESDAPTGLRPAAGRRRGGLGSELVAAAAAIVLLGGGLVLADRHEGDGDPDRFAADYVRTAAVQVEGPGLDAPSVVAFYEASLGRHVVPVALHDAPLTRATVCDLAGALGSMIEYDLAGTRLVHYRIPIARSSDAHRVTEVAVDSRRGVQVAHWMDAEFENALVADASPDYLRWLAEQRFTGPIEVRNYGSPASRSWRPIAN